MLLTDAALKALKPKEKLYKVTDRDGMYVLVTPNGTLSFRLDYRLNGRRETVVFGKYGPAGLSLARAREKCIDAKRAISEGRSPAIEKQLNDLGIFHFWQIAELGGDDAHKIGEELGLPGRIEGWIAQAKELTAEKD